MHLIATKRRWMIGNSLCSRTHSEGESLPIYSTKGRLRRLCIWETKNNTVEYSIGRIRRGDNFRGIVRVVLLGTDNEKHISRSTHRIGGVHFHTHWNHNYCTQLWLWSPNMVFYTGWSQFRLCHESARLPGKHIPPNDTFYRHFQMYLIQTKVWSM